MHIIPIPAPVSATTKENILHESKCTALCYTIILTMDWHDLTRSLMNILPQTKGLRALEGHRLSGRQDRGTLKSLFKGLSNVTRLQAKRQLINTLRYFHFMCHSIWQYVTFFKWAHLTLEWNSFSAGTSRCADVLTAEIMNDMRTKDGRCDKSNVE